MREVGKRTVSLLITMILILSSLGSVGSVAKAEDGEPFKPMDGYTLAFGSGVSPYAYFSPFVPLLTYDGKEVDGYSILFGLKDTVSGSVSEIAYCTDMPVDANDDGIKYQRLNLTDSTYAAEHADKLRAIVLNSYPHVDLVTLQSKSKIEGLTMCEAITGTQLAIWKTAHGDIVQIKDFLYTANAGYNSGHSEPIETERNAYNTGTDEYKAAVKARIEALYDYLMALPEQSATQIVVSKASFVSRSNTPTVTTNEDGTCNVTVKATIHNPGANLTLTAYMGDGTYYAQKAVLSGTNSYELTIENVPAVIAGGAVTLSLDGTQELGEDVYLLDAEGIRGTSQSMIAPLSGTQKVHAEIKCEPDRVLEIYKKTSDGSPLANISFEIYYVGSLEDYLSGKLGIGTKPSEYEIKKYAVTSKLVGTITTNASGYGSLNFGTDDGVYLVKELPNELVESGVAFFVALPDYSRKDKDGNYPAYTVTASPKNKLKDEKVEIEKDVTKLNNEHDTFDIGEEHTWIIQSSIPAAIGIAKAYEITDTLDSRLTLVNIGKVALAKDKGTFGNSEAVGYEKDETETPLNKETVILENDKDYTVTIGKTESGADTFKVALTSAGMRTVANAIATGTADTALNELRVYFTAKINETAAMGETIPNQAHVKYTNNLDRDYSADSDQPEVHTGGTIVYKKSSTSDKVLPGATFEVYRDAKENEQETPTIVIDGEEKKVVKVSFYNTETIENNQQKVNSVTTDENGVAYIYGLAYGTYYLVETQAPAGYNKLNDPISFEINATSHEIDTTGKGGITVVNVPGVELPETGGTGTKAYAIGGWMLIGAAAVLMLARKKRVA